MGRGLEDEPSIVWSLTWARGGSGGVSAEGWGSGRCLGSAVRVLVMDGGLAGATQAAQSLVDAGVWDILF